ncbi:hypothetical protein [uncultured archaeal virus]|uniref:ATPase AAA-type core domain-containing protein n=1 Tax=uncultured archaeal virus TaxID=1960247 RepID=A0A8B0LT22_9VIRU|nr:hypothetical protein [uncultured archaeal virus]
MLIKKLKIDNFKGITSTEFCPKKINLIVGKNNTGKTSILEAIYSVFNTNHIRQYYDKDPSYIIHTGAEYSEIVAETDINRKEIKILNPYKRNSLNENIISSFIKTDNLNEEQVFLIKNLLNMNFKPEEKNIETRKKIKNIESIIKEFNLIENLKEFDFDYITIEDNEKLTFIPFEFLGNGSKTFINLLWCLSSQNIKNKIVLIDNPEIYLHPCYIDKLVKILIKFSEELNIQFFITTHSNDFIYSLFDIYCLTPQEQKYLQNELSVILTSKINNCSIFEYLDYDKAKHTNNELLFDLRGF